MVPLAACDSISTGPRTTALGIELRIDNEGDLHGFLTRLRAIPDDIIEAKQRTIEAVRHLLLYDMFGSREDAFTMVLRQLIPVLGLNNPVPSHGDGVRAARNSARWPAAAPHAAGPSV